MASPPRLDRVDSRARLKPRRDPYWNRLAEGRYLGFRRMTPGTLGTWIARAYVHDDKDSGKKKYTYESLGDFADVEERVRFDAAKKAAEVHFKHLDLGGSTKKVTVKQACEAYVTRLRTEKSEGAADDADGRFTRLVDDDPLGAIPLSKLTPRNVADWRARVLKDTKAKASFNRNATALRAALNLAHQQRDVASDHAWATELKPIEGASARRTLTLDRTQRRSLIDEASDELKPLLTALCLLPLRVGELAACKVSDFNAREGTLRVPAGKTGYRDIPLSKEAVAFFKECVKCKLPGAWLVGRADGRQWDRFTWRDEIKLAAAGAKLPRDTCAYSLRHSVISDLVASGLDLYTISQVSDTSVAMISKHYAHLHQAVARRALSKLAL